MASVYRVNANARMFKYEFKYKLHRGNFNGSKFYRRRRVSKLITATKSAEPMIDQTIGKRVPPIFIANSSGSPNERASHAPISAPINPSAMATRHPPRE